MFTVQNISGQFVPYTKGVIRTKRVAEAVAPVKANEAAQGSGTSEVKVKAEVLLDSKIESYQHLPDKDTPRRRLILAKDLMTTPVMTIDSSLSLGAAWKLIVQKRFRHMLIINTKGKLIGLLSDRDILKALALSENVDPLTTPVSKIMHTDILSAAEETEIREIAKVLFEEKIGCMPILTPQRELSGIITRSDILRALLVHAPLELWI